MSDKTMVLAIFENEIAADTAATSLKDSGVAHRDAIGILVADETGKLKTEKVGKRSMGKEPASAPSWHCAHRSAWASASSAAEHSALCTTRVWDSTRPTASGSAPS